MRYNNHHKNNKETETKSYLDMLIDQAVEFCSITCNFKKTTITVQLNRVDWFISTHFPGESE